MSNREAAEAIRRFGTWPGAVFIAGGLIFLLKGDADGWYGIGVGACWILLVLWLANRVADP